MEKYVAKNPTDGSQAILMDRLIEYIRPVYDPIVIMKHSQQLSSDGRETPINKSPEINLFRLDSPSQSNLLNKIQRQCQTNLSKKHQSPETRTMLIENFYLEKGRKLISGFLETQRDPFRIITADEHIYLRTDGNVQKFLRRNRYEAQMAQLLKIYQFTIFRPIFINFELMKILEKIFSFKNTQRNDFLKRLLREKSEAEILKLKFNFSDIFKTQKREIVLETNDPQKIKNPFLDHPSLLPKSIKKSIIYNSSNLLLRSTIRPSLNVIGVRALPTNSNTRESTLSRPTRRLAPSPSKLAETSSVLQNFSSIECKEQGFSDSFEEIAEFLGVTISQSIFEPQKSILDKGIAQIFVGVSTHSETKTSVLSVDKKMNQKISILHRKSISQCPFYNHRTSISPNPKTDPSEPLVPDLKQEPKRMTQSLSPGKKVRFKSSQIFLPAIPINESANLQKSQFTIDFEHLRKNLSQFQIQQTNSAIRNSPIKAEGHAPQSGSRDTSFREAILASEKKRTTMRAGRQNKDESLHKVLRPNRPLFDSQIVHRSNRNDKKIESIIHVRQSKILQNILPSVKSRSSFSRKREATNSEVVWKMPESFPKVKGLYETFKRKKMDQNNNPHDEPNPTPKQSHKIQIANRNQSIAEKFPYLFK